jgi:hypothetical protein|uniref:Uncharacterized protein n=1 Tax=Picea glauca TaxID=3330 RepID=A0A124GPB3_PICGL|nr:hypothetical protein ABT39_MTgene1291 [Picea glauca]QHR87241.1 hypothetical protein Q903MT_gene1250 [Picea sitchensis]
MELHFDMLNLQLKDLGNELDLDRKLMGSRLNLDMDLGLLAFKLLLMKITDARITRLREARNPD